MGERRALPGVQYVPNPAPGPSHGASTLTLTTTFFAKMLSLFTYARLKLCFDVGPMGVELRARSLSGRHRDHRVEGAADDFRVHNFSMRSIQLRICGS